ncbi:hypothetical protein GDO86_002227, partial [Hymenochirus boettgeri]
HILLLGNEKYRLSENTEQQSLASIYLHRRANSLLIEDNHPVFTVYQASVFGNVKIVFHECPSWDVFKSDLPTSQCILNQADIIIAKYCVNDKASYLDIKENFVPMIKQRFRHCSVPVILSAVGTRVNEVPPCTCPLCASDRGICVTASEGNRLSSDLAATFLELHTLNDFYVVSYFGRVLEYFIIQTLKLKSSEKNKKIIKNNQNLKVIPPKLEQPGKMPVIEEDPSKYESDFQGLLLNGQCVDVVFLTPSLEHAHAAHRIVLCSVSDVFMLLFGEKSARDIDDPSVVRTTSSLFSVCKEHSIADHHSPVRVIVKDPLFCLCLADILHFIYTGAHHWLLLEQRLRQKMKYCGDVAHVIHLVQSAVTFPSLGSCNFSYSPATSCFSDALQLFFNTPVLADIIFQVQDTTILAHRAVLIARCEVLAAMFSGKYLEASSSVIPVYGVSKDTFLCFIEYLYTDSCCPAEERDFVDLHRWPSSVYLMQLGEYRRYIHSQKYKCILM